MTQTAFIAVSSILWLVLLGFSAPSAIAKNKADIAHVELGRQNGNLEVSFQLRNCFTPKMEEAILSGVETTFRIRLVLEKQGLPLLRSKLLDIPLERTIKYHRFRNEFRVELPEGPERIYRTPDFDEAKQWMSRVEDLPLIPLWRLHTGQSYQLRLKAELSKVHLPLFFRYIFFFVSLWDFETGWHTVKFTF